MVMTITLSQNQCHVFCQLFKLRKMDDKSKNISNGPRFDTL
jgi:hypothetical protein